MLKEYASSVVLMLFMLFLFGLNAHAVYRWKSEGHPAPKQWQDRTVFGLFGGVVVMLLMNITWPARIVFLATALLVVVKPRLPWQTRSLQLALLLVVMFAVWQYPAPFSAWLLWLTPLIGLAGYVRLLTTVRIKNVNQSWWLLSCWLWLALLIAATIGDGVFRTSGASAFLQLWYWGFVESPGWWFNVSSLSLWEAIVGGQVLMNFGLLTPYIGFGLIGALAVKEPRPWHFWILPFAVALFACTVVVLMWAFVGSSVAVVPLILGPFIVVTKLFAWVEKTDVQAGALPNND